MVACQTCNTENAPAQKFCGECGAWLPPDEAELRKTVTVVFCDLVGSTALGERVDAEVLRAVMRRYHAELRTVLEQHGGTVEKFVGDAAMAVFGVPRLHEDDALRAVRAALRMRVAAEALGLEVRIGVNTGEVVVGTGETLATGDAVNVAARLEQAASAGEILVGEQTARLVRDELALRPVEPLTLKGKTDPVPAYAVTAAELQEQVAPPAPDRGPLVGREQELAVLEEICRTAAEKRVPQLVTLVGQPGVGKSRLVEELLARTQGRPLVGHCLSYGEGITWWPLVEVLRQLGDVRALLAIDPRAEEVAVRLDAALGVSGAAAAPEEIAWAFRRVVEFLARDRLLVLVLDDIHWAQPPMLDLVDHLISFGQDAALVVLCTARPELFEERPEWSSPRPHATTLVLDALAPEQASALVRELGEMPEELLLRVVEAADGNPLFVQQLVAEYRENRGDDLDVPPSLRALLAARIDRLARAERLVVERAAVEGRVFHRGAVTRLLPPEERPTAGRSLMGLVRRDLVRPDRAQVAGDDGFRFGHVLIRDAAYDSIAKRLRAELHEQYADWLLERLGEAAPREIVGHHLEQAHGYLVELADPRSELRDRAADVLYSAAEAAAARGDVKSASNLYARALGLTPDDPPRRQRLIEYARVLMQTGGAEEALVEAIELAQRAGDERTEWLARLQHAEAGLQHGKELELGQASATARRALEWAEPDDHLIRAHAHDLLGHVAKLRGRMEEALASVDRAMEHARSAGDLRLLAELGYSLAGAVVYGPLSVQEGLRRMQRLREELGRDVGLRLMAMHVEAHLVAREGRFEEALLWIRTWRRHLEELGQRRTNAVTAACEWDVAVLGGDLVAGERALREGFDQLAAVGDRVVRGTLAAGLGEAAYRRGDLEEAERWAGVSADLGDPADLENEAIWRAVLAKVLAARGRHEEAITLAREGIDLAEQTDEIEQQARNRQDLAVVLAAAGQLTRAREELVHALKLFRRKGNLVSAAEVQHRLEELGVP